MKFKYRNRQFWCRGYYVETVGKNEIAIKKLHRKSIEIRSYVRTIDIG